MISGIEAYRTYLAISSHFTRDYDYFKYNGHVNASVTSYEKRRDKYFFEKAAKKFKTKEQLVEYLVSQYRVSKKSNVWIGEILDAKGQDNHREWLRVVESLEYTFKNDLSKLEETNDKFAFNTEHSTKHPSVYRLFIMNEISLETVCILNKIIHFTDKWQVDMLLDEYKKLINDYTPFLMSRVINLDKYKRIVSEIFS